MQQILQFMSCEDFEIMIFEEDLIFKKPIQVN